MNQPAYPHQLPPGAYPNHPPPAQWAHPQQQMMWGVPPRQGGSVATAGRFFLTALFLAPVVLITAWGAFIEYRLAAIERLDHGRVMEMQAQLQDVSTKLQKVTEALLQIINLPESQKPPETEPGPSGPSQPAALPGERPGAPVAPANRPVMQPESPDRPTRRN